MTDFLSAYNSKETEKKIYELWEESGFFNPDNLPSDYKKSFCMIMPPPNANGPLHIGHALFVTIQDILIRFWRMQKYRTLWLPGADHAGFETQVVYDKKLEKEGRNRFQIPREELWREIWDFTQKNKKIMENQLRRLGASCDWSREKFTLNPDIIKIVYETFFRLYKDGLVYRDSRVVNWCVKHQTSLSDLEVKYVEKNDPLYYLKYGPLTLATVRPETKFGDTGLAVNPKDKRYQKYIGQEIKCRGLTGSLKFKIIADAAVDPLFGTGVVKITPAHDSADFEIWQRHKNEIPGPKQVIDERGRLTADAGPYRNLKAAEARIKIAEDMKKIGILEKQESDYKHQVATCYKCGSVLEPLLKKQWFVKMTVAPKSGGLSLRDSAIKAVKNKDVKFVTKKFEKIFLHWMKNIRDWNISRQIVWGIRIPAWHCFCPEEKQIIFVGEKPPAAECAQCQKEWQQDPDVFDTWFSSGQWPFAALMASDKNDFKNFYPTDVIETAYDILFFWVARMIIFGVYRIGKVPFKHIYLHGLVRDQDRQKMSKSKGNVIDPLGVAEIYGTDAVRMALIAGTAAGNDPVISEDKIRGYRNFSTKIWNIARFISLASESVKNESAKKITKPKFTANDKKYLKEFTEIKRKIARYLKLFKINQAGELAYQYLWHCFADQIMEEAKTRIQKGELADQVAALTLLKTIFFDCLKILHPFMPFITEEIYQRMFKEKENSFLMTENWGL